MTNQRPCSIPFEVLLAWRDGELPLWRRTLLRRHIASCAACQQEISLMNQITQELREDEAQAEPMPTILRERIIALAPEPAATKATSSNPQKSQSSAPQAATSTSLAPSALAPSAKAPDAKASKSRGGWLEWSAMAGACALLAVFALTISGRRISNTFNAAADKLATTSDSSESYSSSSSSSSSSGAASSSDTASDTAKSKSSMRTRGIAGPSAGSSAGASGVAGAAASTGSDSLAASLPSSLRRVHKEARIGVGVPDVEDKAEAVEALTKSVGGFVSSNTLSTGSGGLKSAALSIRVPVGSFESVLSQIGKLGSVQSKTIAGEDITERFSDQEAARQVLDSELSVKESQLQAAMAREDAARRAPRSGDGGFRVPWQQRSEVRQLRIQAAQSRARLELLRKISELSNIQVELNEKRAAPGQAGFTQEMGQTTSQAFSSFAVAVRVPLAMLIWVLAYAPLWLPAIVLYRLAIKRLDRQPAPESLQESPGA